MPDTWVTTRSCKVCRADHDDTPDEGTCDHWCHDAGAEDWEDGEPGA